jgi:hypothetical protein
LPDPPAAWEWGASAHLLVGVLAHSSRWRAVLAEAEDQPQLIEAIDAVVRRILDARTVFPDRGGHLGLGEHPEVTRAIRDFLGRVAPIPMTAPGWGTQRSQPMILSAVQLPGRGRRESLPARRITELHPRSWVNSLAHEWAAPAPWR